MKTSLTFAKDFLHLADKRAQFFEFTPKALYGASFKEWYEMGCYEPHYIPYAYFSESELVANVSITQLKVWVQGKALSAIQFATVGTLPEYQKQGLSRSLMEKVLKDFEENTDLFFLFANDSVLEFYPKFGFNLVKEHLFEAVIPKISPKFSARKLDMHQASDFQLIQRLLKNRWPLTQVFGAKNDQLIFCWHALYILSDCLWYLENQDVLIVCQVEGDTLEIYDIVTTEAYSFLSILPMITNTQIQKIHFYFTPEKLDIEAYPIEFESDSPLFVKGDFPIQAPFKFPLMGQT